MNPGLNKTGFSEQLANQGKPVTNEAPALLSDFNLAAEVNSLISEPNLTKAASSVMNVERLLIQKKIALDQVSDDDLLKLLKFLDATIKKVQQT